MIRILHVLPDLSMGGGQQLVLRNIQCIDREQFEHHLCFFRPGESDDLEIAFREVGVTPRLIRHRGWWYLPGVVRQVKRLIREQKIDIVHVQGTPLDKIYGQLAASSLDVPVVRTLHGLRPADERLRDVMSRPRPRRVVRYLRRRGAAVVDRFVETLGVRHFVAVSDDVRSSWRPMLKARRVSDDQITVCYNGVNLDQYAFASGVRDEVRSELGLTDADPLLISVGNLCRRKGQDLLLDVMSRLVKGRPQARLALVGDGELRPLLEQTIGRERLGDHVRLLGQRMDIPRLLAAADVFVFATTGANEGFPLCVLEAMAAHLPVVAADFPGLERVVIDGETGFRVRPRSAETLAAAIGRLLDDREMMRAMGRAARALVERQFDTRAAVHRLEEIYRRVSTPQ